MIKWLYDEIAKRWYRGGNIWLYSDPHFDDPELEKYRTITAEEQIANINKRVGKKDTIIFLGDIGNLERIKAIRGYKVLIMGNHDEGSAEKYKRKIQYILDNEKGTYEIDLNMYIVNDNHLFDEVYEGPLMINNKIILSHEPMDLPEYMFNIHGHVHGSYIFNRRRYNVCAEFTHFEPISLISLLKNGIAHTAEDIHRVTIDNATERKAKKGL